MDNTELTKLHKDLGAPKGWDFSNTRTITSGGVLGECERQPKIYATSELAWEDYKRELEAFDEPIEGWRIKPELIEFELSQPGDTEFVSKYYYIYSRVWIKAETQLKAVNS